MCGLMRALVLTRPYAIGAKKFIVEVDAQYLKGMLKNPEHAPSATVNRWVAIVKLHDFELVHVPAVKFKGPDGLSRRAVTDKERDEAEDEADFEEWVEERLEQFVMWHKPSNDSQPSEKADTKKVEVLALEDSYTIPVTSKSKQIYQDLPHIRYFLTNLTFPKELSLGDRERISSQISKFLLINNNLYRRYNDGQHKKVVNEDDRVRILTSIHDELGHKGFHPCRSLLSRRFWWPNMFEDLKWFLKTCQTCQERNVMKLNIPPTVPEPASLLHKFHIDTFYMPKHHGYKYVIHAVCSLTGWPEAKALIKETAKSVGDFIFDFLLCRFGAISEIVTDNGPPIIKALEYISKTYHINHIKISPYNSQANGAIERAHYGLRETLVKTCGDRIQDWPSKLPFCLWAQRITTKKQIGYSPYQMVYGNEPLFPFDLEESTFLAPNPSVPMDTNSLIALRARALEKRPEDIAQMRKEIWKIRRILAARYEEVNKHTIRDYDFKPGALVLVRNSAEESGMKNKYKARYLGPFIVVKRTQGGAYSLAEMDGTISNLRFAAKRVIPFHIRSRITLPASNQDLNNANDVAINPE
jgi:hypothetical protein